MAIGISKTSLHIKRLVLSALFLALGLILPFLTGQIPQIGNMLLPMHIPVLLCGFICGPVWGLAVGFICPLLRSALFGAPIMYPMAVSMAFELGTYGLISGLFYALLPKKVWSVYVSLLCAMIAGRLVWGIARLIMAVGTDSPFLLPAFIAGAFTSAIPGIILQLILVPAVVLLLGKSRLIPKLKCEKTL